MLYMKLVKGGVLHKLLNPQKLQLILVSLLQRLGNLQERIL